MISDCSAAQNFQMFIVHSNFLKIWLVCVVRDHQKLLRFKYQASRPAFSGEDDRNRGGCDAAALTHQSRSQLELGERLGVRYLPM